MTVSRPALKLRMTKDQLNPYSGVLELASIANGMNAARRNAIRLANDAEALLERGSFATAAALAILALEECGKNSILRHMAMSAAPESTKLWREYRSHTSKNFLSMATDIMHRGGRRLEDFLECCSSAGQKDREVIDALKQVAIYTDCLGNAHWSEPANVISQNIASAFVRDAKLMAESENDVSVRELELWRKHLGDAKSFTGLCEWALAMEEENLRPAGFAEKFKGFIV